MSTTNILIIEDNPADIALIEVYLKDAAMKHILFKSESLNAGLDFLKEHSVDLVLLDLKLVDVEGFKTLQLFREKAPDIPVIVLTGFKNEIMGIQSVRAGAQDFLVKGDFDSRSLARTIRYSLQRFETQVKLQEKAKELSHSERRNQIAHQIARFGKWEMDIVNNAMRWDEEIFRFFGFSPFSFEPTLSDYIKYVHVADKEKVSRFFEQAIKDGQAHHIEHRIIIENTIVRYLQVKAQVSYDEQSNRILLVGGVQDITDLKHARGLDGRMAQPDGPGGGALEEGMLSEFNFSIRTPVASMANLLYLLENSPLTESQKDFVGGLKSSLGALSFALDNWLNLSILQEEKIEVKNSELALDEAFQTLRNVFKTRSSQAGSAVAFDLSDKLPEIVFTDSQKFSQVLYNLIETAIRNGEPGQAISFTAQLKEPRRLSLFLSCSVSFVSRSTTAEDIQRAAEEEKAESAMAGKQRRAFLPFVISSRLIKAMDGCLEASQKPGMEILLKADLPVKLPEAVREAIPEVPEAPVSILLVEDHDLNRLATKRMLAGWSETVEVDVAQNGLEAYEKVIEKNYDLILMDIQMPLMDGIEAAIKIRNKTNAPIIAMAANESKQEEKRCFMAGMNDYIAKPIRPESLFSAIMRQLHLNK
ncbi:MAG: response regulator [Lewinellaceae bacterium]|nr:response regulator [Phaeodactylibacter sp.]MCB9035024.1 response regulator [Lewinellaceae bacterium]